MDSIIVQELSLNDDYHHYCCLLKQLTKINVEEMSSDAFFKQLMLIKMNPFHKIMVAKYENKIIGSITILIEPKFVHNLSKVSHIEDFIVDSNYRSLGVGKCLMKKAIDISKEEKCYKIILDCSDKNINFYKKFDFVEKENQMALYLE